MSVDNNVNLQYVANQYQKNNISTKSQHHNQGNPNAVDKTPDKDPVQLASNKPSKKGKVGIAAVVTTVVAVTLAVLGRKGHLGKCIQKFFGGKTKEIENAAKRTVEKAKVPSQEAKVGKEAKAKAEQEAKAKAEQEAKAKAEQEAKAKAEQEAKAKAEQEIKDIEIKETKFAEQIPNMSRSELAKSRYNLDSYDGDLYQLEKKSQKKGLTKLERARLDSLKRQRELVRNRENEIEKSLETYKPTYANNTQVSMHHDINGHSSEIRYAVEARANDFKGLNEEDIRNIRATEEYMTKINKEFAQLPPLEKECIVYRGRAESPLFESSNKDFKMMDNSKVGDVVVPDTGYSYTAFNRSVAEAWGGEGARGYREDGSLARSLMYEIHLPRGAKVSRNGEHSGEVLMPQGAQYIVKDKKVDKEGCMEVVLEYILPKV